MKCVRLFVGHERIGKKIFDQNNESHSVYVEKWEVVSMGDESEHKSTQYNNKSLWEKKKNYTNCVVILTVQESWLIHYNNYKFQNQRFFISIKFFSLRSISTSPITESIQHIGHKAVSLIQTSLISVRLTISFELNLFRQWKHQLILLFSIESRFICEYDRKSSVLIPIVSYYPIKLFIKTLFSNRFNCRL